MVRDIHESLAPYRPSLSWHFAGEWRKGEVRDQDGSSEENPRYLVSVGISQDSLTETE